MRTRFASQFVVALLLVFGLSVPSWAQQIEIHPFAGGFFPGSFADTAAELKSEGVYGIRAGTFVTEQFQVDGNLGYINHFAFDGTDPRSRAFMWGIDGSYHFLGFDLGRFEPFVTLGFGGLTLRLPDVDSVTFALAEEAAVIVDETPVVPVRTVTLSGGDTFFTITYGGGVKGNRIWGPVGLRADIRGRTLPNFSGNSYSWPEISGGVNFVWGER